MNEKKLFFLNEFGYNLQCDERVISIMLEELCTNSMLLEILFKEEDCWDMKRGLYGVVEDRLGVRFTEEMINIDFVEELFNKARLRDSSFITYSDHYYNKEYKLYFQKSHYSHPIFVNNINRKDHYIDIIDEDIEEQQNYDKFMYWDYKKKRISFEIFEEICRRWGEEKKSYRILYLIQKEEKKNMQLDDILNIYNQYIKFNMECFNDRKVILYNDYKLYCQRPGKNTPFAQWVYDFNKAVNRAQRLVELVHIDSQMAMKFINYCIKLSKYILDLHANILKFSLRSVDNNSIYTQLENLVQSIPEYYSLLIEIYSRTELKEKLYEKIHSLQ